MEKKQYKTTNSGTIAAGSLWYPFQDSGSPSDLEISEHFPLRSFTIENKSQNSIKVILDPIGGSSNKEYDIPDGKTLSLENRDLVTFYNVVIQNVGATTIDANKIKSTVRNY